MYLVLQEYVRAKPMTSLWFKITDFDIETGAWSWISLNAEVSEKD